MIELARVVEVDPKSRQIVVEGSSTGRRYNLPIPAFSIGNSGGLSVYPYLGDMVFVVKDDYNMINAVLPIILDSDEEMSGRGRPPLPRGSVALTTLNAALILHPNGTLYAFAKQDGEEKTRLYLMPERTEWKSPHITLHTDAISVDIDGRAKDVAVYEFKYTSENVSLSLSINSNQATLSYTGPFEFSVTLTDKAVVNSGDTTLTIARNALTAQVGETEMTLSSSAIVLQAKSIQLKANELNVTTDNLSLESDTATLDVSTIQQRVQIWANSGESASFRFESFSLRADKIDMRGDAYLKGPLNVKGDLSVSGSLKRDGDPVATVTAVNRAFQKTYNTLGNIVRQFNTHVHPIPQISSPTLQPATPLVAALTAPRLTG